jgi:hypothetical protein
MSFAYDKPLVFICAGVVGLMNAVDVAMLFNVGRFLLWTSSLHTSCRCSWLLLGLYFTTDVAFKDRGWCSDCVIVMYF